MYNKLFTKILDSSIWLEPVTTRIVWITLIASMDEDGYCHFSAIQNLSIRAGVSIEECNAAVTILLSPDKNSSDPDHEGRRIERVPGGFIVLNAHKHRDIVTREKRREQTKKRVQKYRERHQNHQSNNLCNAVVTHVNENVTPSEARAVSVSVSEELRSSSLEGSTLNKKKSKKLNDSEFIAELKKNPAFSKIDIDRELSKMDAWLLSKPGRQKTRRFVINWLNRIDEGMASNSHMIKKDYLKGTGCLAEDYKL